MRPLHIWARNVRTWGELDLEVPEGVVAVVGPNGAGKSTLVQVVDLALFGSGRELKRALSRTAAEPECEVGLEFEHRGEVYRVRRSYTAKGSGKSRLDFERGLELYDHTPSPAWEALTRETIEATERELEALLGITRQTYRASSYLAQGEGAAFTAAPPRERKAILLEALGVRLWDDLHKRAAAERLEREREASKLLGQVEALEGQLAHRAGAQASIAAAREAAERLRMAVDDLARGTEALKDEYTDASALEARSLQARARHEATLARLNDAQRRLAALQAQGAKDEVWHRDGVDAAVDACAALARKAEALKAGEATCPTCHQYLAGHALTTALAEVRSALAEAEARRDAALERATETEQRNAAAIAALLEAMPELERATADAGAAAGEQGGQPVPELRRRLQAAEQQLAERRQALTNALAEVARAEAAAEGHAALEQGAAEGRERLTELQGEVAMYKLAERAYSRDGIPALILEAAALPQLEAEANRIIGELGRTYRFELRSQRATQAGTVQEALDIVVHTEQGEAAYEDFSGGERTRLDLALRIALARLLAARRGADVRLLAIDEPAYLDAEGFERLAAVLQGLTSEFATVLVVSHVSELRDAFDTALVVEGGADTGLPSRLAEAVLV